MGRSADAALRMGRKGAALCYSYSLSRGAFIGEARDQQTRDDIEPCHVLGAACPFALCCHKGSKCHMLMFAGAACVSPCDCRCLPSAQCYHNRIFF